MYFLKKHALGFLILQKVYCTDEFQQSQSKYNEINEALSLQFNTVLDLFKEQKEKLEISVLIDRLDAASSLLASERHKKKNPIITSYELNDYNQFKSDSNYEYETMNDKGFIF